MSVVIDTTVVSALLDLRPTSSGAAYRALIQGRPIVISFATVAELRYGAFKANWGELRRRRMERSLSRVAISRPDDELIDAYARMRHTCEQRGHPLGQKVHEADRWIAATAFRLGLELITADRVFDDVEGLIVVRADSS